MSALVDFYTGSGTDSQGRTLAEIHAWDDAKLEAVHDYIQWLFPLPEASAYNPDAPLLTDGDITAFHDRDDLHTALGKSLVRMRVFYGLPSGKARQAQWVTPGNHNMLRLSRILRSLHLLGLEHEAHALFRDLEALYKAGAGAVIGPVTLGYWRRAAT